MWLPFLRLLANPDVWLAAILRARGNPCTDPGLVLDYARAMRCVVEPRQMSWRERLLARAATPSPVPPHRPYRRGRFRRPESDGIMTEQVLAGPTSRNLMVSSAVVVATAMLFGLTYSLSTSLIALDLAERGFGDGMIGLNAAMQAIGVLVVAPLLLRLVGRFGIHSMVLAALVTTAPVLAAFPFMPSLALWFPLRILLGGSIANLFVLAQTWVTGLSTERQPRPRLTSPSASLGLALGPLILALIGSVECDALSGGRGAGADGRAAHADAAPGCALASATVGRRPAALLPHCAHRDPDHHAERRARGGRSLLPAALCHERGLDGGAGDPSSSRPSCSARS